MGSREEHFTYKQITEERWYASHLFKLILNSLRILDYIKSIMSAPPSQRPTKDDVHTIVAKVFDFAFFIFIFSSEWLL